ncbi:MAG TPA: iron uptake system protein EfeO, partial [Gaiellaceae bacterium]
PTFVIGLREGTEAALIVGIIGAFLRQEGRRDALRFMWLGVAAAVVLCVGIAVGLQLLDEDLPQAQQEGLETVVAAVAVAMVTFMILWMRRHARGLAGELRASAASALQRGSTLALVAMAFFAVVREGIETSVFLLAAFQASGNATAAGIGATLGVLVAVLLGYGIYRGGVRLNLARFFRVTGVALVLVAAGLVMSAIHTAHEATWLNSLQGKAVDLGWLVRPGTVVSSLLTGVLGLQPQPTVGEAAGWLLYAIPMLAIVLWPRGVRLRNPLRGREAAGVGMVCLVVLLVAAGCGDKKSAAPGAHALNVALVDGGCSPEKLSVPAGPVTFNVKNGGTSKVSELELKSKSGIILGERENIVSGIDGSFSLNLKPGTYVLNCPNGDEEDNGAVVVTGTGGAASPTVDAKLVARAVTGYRSYVQAQTAQLLAGTRQFVAALQAGDVARAKALYAPTRYHYEAIEPVAESFGNLDPEIDARVNDVSSPSQWTGFHRIEKILWVGGTTVGTQRYAAKLLTNVEQLRKRVKTLDVQAAQLANGAVELLDEVASSKITGEEDRYSHTDLSDFAGNLEGARRAFELLRPVLVAGGSAKLAATIGARFDDVSRSLARYKLPNGRYAAYGVLTGADRRRFASQVDALAEPLSTVAATVAA